jgi:hypothetical protein
VFAIRQTYPRSSASRSIVAARRSPSTGADRNRLHHDHDFRRKTIASCQHLADIPALSGRSPSHAISIIRSVRIDRSRHTPAVWLAVPRTAALRTSANRRPTRGPSVRATSRSFSPHRREIGEVTAETNLQHRDRLPYALPAASYNALRDSVPLFALVGSNRGGLPRAAPCSAGVDTADGFPVCVHLLVSVVDAPVRLCYWPMPAVKPITPLRSRPPIRTTSQR